jgi:hypothetical protein
MRHHPRLSRVFGALRAGLASTVAMWTIACGNGQDALAPSTPPLHVGLVVSAAQAIRPSPPTPFMASVLQLAPGATEVAYVSMPPGMFAGRSGASITNPRTGGSVQVPLIDGGLDPFPIPATAGDTLVVEIASSGGQPSVTLVRVVPTALLPGVVRTQPAPGKRDVALLDVVQIVFTEPMSRATINGANISLLRNGERVAGQVALAADGFTATFRPDAALAPGTQYVLVVGAGVAGLDGAPLGTPVTVAFTTGTASAPPPPPLALPGDPGLSALPGERWILITKLASVTGPVCVDWPLAIGTSHQELMAVQRSGQSIALVHDLLNWPTDDVPLVGTITGNDFTATTATAPGSMLCSGAQVSLGFEASVSGRFSADGRSLTAEEVWSYRRPSGDTFSLHFTWSATPQ